MGETPDVLSVSYHSVIGLASGYTEQGWRSPWQRPEPGSRYGHSVLFPLR